MNTLKTGLLTVGLLIGATSFAQQSVAVDKANIQTENLAKELSLTPEQKAKVSELNIGIAKKNDAITNSPNLTPEQKKEHLQGNNNAKTSQMKMILTEEQYAKYITTPEAKEANREKMKVEEKK